MRLLVTGGAGFIGTNFVHYWLRKHPDDRVVVLDALTYAGHLDNLHDCVENPRFRFVEGDIADEEQVYALLREEQVDTLVHFAAESHVDRSIDGPDAFVRTNVVGTHALLKAAREAWLENGVAAHRFHHVSTDEVYGSLGAGDPAFSEITPYAPNSPYAASKAASDHLVRAYGATYGLNITISNCSNNYGPWQLPEKLIPLAIRHLRVGKTIPVYGDGGNVRDWLHVEDHCRGIEAILERGQVGRTYNIGGHNERANIDVVHLLCRLFDERFPGKVTGGHETLIEFVTDRPGHDRRYAINPVRMETELGFSIERRFEDGVADTLDWYLAHADWVERYAQRLPAWLDNPAT